MKVSKMKTIVHVNQHIIKSNKKYNECVAPLACKTYKSNQYGFNIELKGPSRIVYRPDKPLPCGAHVWIETYAPVKVS